MVGQLQQHRVERVEINAVGVPTGVEVAGFVLSGDEAAVQPNLSAAGLGEQFDCFCESVEQTSAAFGPSEPLDHLVPRRYVLTRWQPAAVWIERWKHTTTLSLWLLPTATHEFGEICSIVDRGDGRPSAESVRTIGGDERQASGLWSALSLSRGNDSYGATSEEHPRRLRMKYLRSSTVGMVTTALL